MVSRGAAAAAFRALRSAGGTSRRGASFSSISSTSSTSSIPSSSSSNSSSSLLRRRLLDDHQIFLQSSSSALRASCPLSSPPPPSSSACNPSRTFSADAAAAPASSKVILAKDDAHYAAVMKDIESKDALAVVYFTAQWCGPCKQIAPYIDELSQNFDDVAFVKIDVDKVEVERTMVNSNIGVVPTFHFHKKGKLIGELTGAAKDKLKSLVETLRLEK